MDGWVDWLVDGLIDIFQEDDEPHITHGYTLVTKMPAKENIRKD